MTFRTTEATVPIPAIQGGYGPRLFTYTTQVTPKALEAILGHDPRSKYWRKLEPPELKSIYEQLQRNTTAERLRGIQAYIRKRFKKEAVILGAFPAISIAVKRFIRFEDFDTPDMEGAGRLHLDISRQNSRIVLDGLARVSGIIELTELANAEELSTEERKSLNGLLEDFTIPIVIYAPRDPDHPLQLKEFRQLFADFNFKQTSISPTMAMAMDSSDLYIEATKRFGENGVIQNHGGMEKKSASLGKKSTALVVLQNLVRFTRAAAEGDQFAELKTNVDKVDDKRRLDEENLEDFIHRVDTFLSGVAEGMGNERFKDTKSAVHTTGPGWGAMGAIFYDLDATLGRSDLFELGRKIGEVDMRKEAPFWSDIMREREIRGKMAITFVGGGYESRQAIRRKLHQHLGTWNALQEAQGSGDEADAPPAAAAE